MADFAGKPKYFVQYVNGIAILYMNNGENHWNIESVTSMLQALDEVERSDAVALITTGVGKFYSNGIDLKWVGQQDKATAENMTNLFFRLQKRILMFPMPTIAAINGHAYAGGAAFTFYHDFRVMRTRQGWFCLSEIHVGVLFSTQTFAIMNKRFPMSTLRDMALFGKRFTAEEALDLGIVDAVTENAGLLDLSVALAKKAVGKQGINRKTLVAMKKGMYADVLRDFDDAINNEMSSDATKGFMKAASKL